MQVQKVSVLSVSNTQKVQPVNSNLVSKVNTVNSDSVSFGHGILMPDTQSAIKALMQKLQKLGRPLAIQDMLLGDITATANKKIGATVWDLVLTTARGKGANKEINTYYYCVNNEKIAKQVRLGASSRFIEEETLGEMGKLEWNNSVQAIAAVLFRHLP